VMAAPVISISSEESVGSHAPRVILFGAIPAIIPVIPKVPIVPADSIVTLEVGTVSVISPAGVLDLVDYSPSSDSDPLKDSLPSIPDLPLVSPFLCSDYLEADGESEPAEQRPVSSSHDTFAPLSEFPLAPVVAPPEIRRWPAILVRPGKCTFRSFLIRTYTTRHHDADSSIPQIFVHRSLATELIQETQILAPELIQETTEKIIQIKQRMQAARDRQKSYAEMKRKPMEFQVGDKVMLKVWPWKGVVRFGKRGKLNLRYVGPFKVLEKVGEVAYKLELPEELSRVHNTFHVSNLKKCHVDEPLAVSLDGLHLDDKLHFVEEPVEIVGREVKRLKQSRIPLIKVRWNSKRGPEFTWEREDQFKKKYLHLFTKTAPLSSAAS
ncbi:hypothetical protein Tco_1127495, partial [Tanacetum coccineum]